MPRADTENRQVVRLHGLQTVSRFARKKLDEIGLLVDAQAIRVASKCGQCGQEFIGLRRHRRQFCSVKCRNTALARKQTQSFANCAICGGRFRYQACYAKRGPNHAKFCSKACKGGWMTRNPHLFPQIRGRRGRGGKRADLGNRYFRSSWEANWARYLNWLKSIGEIQEWEYEVDTFEFVGIKRGTRFYLPDFKVTNKDSSIEYHEVKGWLDPRSATKLKRMKKYHPNVRLLLIGKDQYREVANKVGALIPNWERIGGKVARND